MAIAPSRLLLLAALGLSGCVRLGPDFQTEPVTWIEHWNSPALEQASQRQPRLTPSNGGRCSPTQCLTA